MSRQCQCGGVISTSQLAGNREAWKCKSCGRYDQVVTGSPHAAEYAGHPMPPELLITDDSGDVIVDVALNPHTAAIESACLPLHPDRPAWKLAAESNGWVIAHSTIPQMLAAMDNDRLYDILH